MPLEFGPKELKHPPKLGMYLVMGFLPDLPFMAGLFRPGLFACGCPAPSIAESLHDTTHDKKAPVLLTLVGVLPETLVYGVLVSGHVELCNLAEMEEGKPQTLPMITALAQISFTLTARPTHTISTFLETSFAIRLYLRCVWVWLSR